MLERCVVSTTFINTFAFLSEFQTFAKFRCFFIRFFSAFVRTQLVRPFSQLKNPALRQRMVKRWWKRQQCYTGTSSRSRLISNDSENLPMDTWVLCVDTRVSHLSIFVDKEKPCTDMICVGNDPDISMLVQVRGSDDFT